MSNDSKGNTPLKIATLFLTLAVSVVFVVMIRGFLIALFLGAVFSGLSYPLYTRFVALFHGRSTLAAVTTLIVLLLVVILPLLGLFGIVAAQAYQLSTQAAPWLEEQIENPEGISLSLPEWVPFREKIEEPGPDLVSKIGEFAGKVGGFLASSLAVAASGTASFFLNLFVMLYAMFWFIKIGPTLNDKMMNYVPLPRETKQRLIAKGLSVTRATIKGTFVIGIVQGTLGGIAFAVVGIEGAAFWGCVMAVASAIPSIGTALVWVPAVVYLMVTGDYIPAVGLLAWCAGVVGTIDNVLRPRLVGGDTEMPDLIILVSAFGGLSMFGAVGILLGPTIAAVFITMWDVFAVTFQDELAAAEEDLPRPQVLPD